MNSVALLPAARFPLLAAAGLLLALASALALGGEKPAPGPAEAPAEEKPANPFGETKPARADAVPGKVVLSDGKEHRGTLSLTRDKKVELFEDARNEWHKLDLKDLKTLSFAIEKEEVVKEWRWKEPGSDVKVETGRTKVDRKYLCTAVTNDGKKIAGHIRGTVIYVVAAAKKGAGEGEAPAEPQRFFLHKDQPGDFDQKPEDLVYVKEIVFGEEAAREPEKKPEETKPPEKKPEEAKVSLILLDGGERKIAVIKAVREITNLGLKEAKELVDGAPKTVKGGLSRAEAEELQKKLEAAGAKMKIEQP